MIIDGEEVSVTFHIFAHTMTDIARLMLDLPEKEYTVRYPAPYTAPDGTTYAYRILRVTDNIDEIVAVLKKSVGCVALGIGDDCIDAFAHEIAKMFEEETDDEDEP